MEEKAMRLITFRVAGSTQPREVVCLSGNCPELGNWKSECAIVLQREIELGLGDTQEIWCTKVMLPIQEIQFRYFIATLVEAVEARTDDNILIVRRWEVMSSPRNLWPADSEAEGTNLHIFGEARLGRAVERGWITKETVLQFKFLNNPIELWRKKDTRQPIRIKVSPVTLQERFPEDDALSNDSFDCYNNNGTSSTGWPIVEIAVINETEHRMSLQKQFGRTYRKDDIIVFQVQVLDLKTTLFVVDFYADSDNGESPRHIGSSHILPDVIKDLTIGTKTLPIVSWKHEPRGKVVVDCVIVKPLPSSPCDLQVSASKAWDFSTSGLDIGHRGCGNSSKNFKWCANLKENTIKSLQNAADHGADMVEFDVQLTKDNVPVLFHDFHVNVGLHHKTKTGGQASALQIPVKDLTLIQLKEFKVAHVGDDPHNDAEDHETELFPTLQSALEEISETVGFNIEIKWTMELHDGTWELENPFELNFFIDTILHTVLKYAGSRLIVFSCFHPDVCALIQLKQNRFPVVFLTQGITQKWPEYKDPRTRNIAVAVHYALSAGLLGLCVHTEDILRDPLQVSFVLQEGLVLFCWGEDNNNAATIKYLKQLGLTGIIYDRIEETIDIDKKISAKAS